MGFLFGLSMYCFCFREPIKTFVLKVRTIYRVFNGIPIVDNDGATFNQVKSCHPSEGMGYFKLTSDEFYFFPINNPGRSKLDNLKVIAHYPDNCQMNKTLGSPYVTIVDISGNGFKYSPSAIGASTIVVIYPDASTDSYYGSNIVTIRKSFLEKDDFVLED